jgi:hypothetical protein
MGLPGFAKVDESDDFEIVINFLKNPDLIVNTT